VTNVSCFSGRPLATTTDPLRPDSTARSFANESARVIVVTAVPEAVQQSLVGEVAYFIRVHDRMKAEQTLK
jgi:hypothetical protein